MQSIFGADLHDLELSHLCDFLETATTEPLVWEGKGGETAPHPASIRKHVSGLANRLGGWLIIGANQVAGGWELRGVEFADPEPERWISDCLSELRPPPYFDTQLIPDGDSWVAVIEVEPMAVPPCMTPEGEIFQRQPGKTPRVKEPLILQELISRGRGQRLLVSDRARAHARSLVRSLPMRDVPLKGIADPTEARPVFGLAVSALDPPSDAATRPFEASLSAFLSDLGGSRLRTDRFTGHPFGKGYPQSHHSQGASWLSVDGRISNWVVFAHWDGSAAFSWGCLKERTDPTTLLAIGDGPPKDDGRIPNEGELHEAWRHASSVLKEMGCRGEAVLAIYVDGRSPHYTPNTGEFTIERTIEIGDPDPDQFAGVAREFRRALREFVEEPEREDPAEPAEGSRVPD